jgi:hypothetical protein
VTKGKLSLRFFPCVSSRPTQCASVYDLADKADVDVRRGGREEAGRNIPQASIRQNHRKRGATRSVSPIGSLLPGLLHERLLDVELASSMASKPVWREARCIRGIDLMYFMVCCGRWLRSTYDKTCDLPKTRRLRTRSTIVVPNIQFIYISPTQTSSSK